MASLGHNELKWLPQSNMSRWCIYRYNDDQGQVLYGIGTWKVISMSSFWHLDRYHFTWNIFIRKTNYSICNFLQLRWSDLHHSCLPLWQDSQLRVTPCCHQTVTLNPPADVRQAPTYDIPITLTHSGRDKMAVIYQTTFSNAFSWMKIIKFWLKFHLSLFLRVQLTIFHHWFRWWLGAVQATSHYLNQWW